MSATHRRFGAVAKKSLSSRSSGMLAGSPGTVVTGRLRRGRTPAFRQLAHQAFHRASRHDPALRVHFQHTFRAPDNFRLLVFHTDIIFFFSTASRASRAVGSASRSFAK